MGNIKLYQQQDSTKRMDNVLDVVYSSVISSLDDFIEKRIKEMYEAKAAYLILVLFGIPAAIYAWFLNIGGAAEFWKGIILAALGGLTMLVLLCRYFIKLLREWEEFKRDFWKGRAKR